MTAIPTDDGPYRAMWSAVLIQAIKDLDGKYSTDRTQAKAYVFRERGELVGSFDWICTHLDLDPEVIRTIVMTREGRRFLKDKNRRSTRKLTREASHADD